MTTADRGHGARGADAGASWWDYVGWAPARGASTSASVFTGEVPAGPPPLPVASPSTEEISGSGVSAAEVIAELQPRSEDDADKASPADAPAAIPEAGDDKGAQKEQREGQQVAVWYSPWAWYAPSPSARKDVAPQAPGETAKVSDATQRPQAEPMMRVRTGSVTPHEVSPPPSSPQPSPLDAAPVPIPASPLTPAQLMQPESTITSSLSGWAAYFTSRSRVNMLGGRTIEAREVVRDENGCEVMDIDSDDDTASVSERGRTTALTTGTRQLKDRSPSGARRRSPAPGGGGAAAARGSMTTTTTSTLSTTTMASSSAAAGSRTSSPAPAYPKKPPAPPAPPNLVLPTWADTFFVPPRSVLPPRPPTPTPPGTAAMPISPKTMSPSSSEGVLGKTIKFVGSVLFAAPSSPVPQPESPPTRTRSKSTHTRRPARLTRMASASSGVSMRVQTDESEVEPEGGEEDLGQVLQRHRRAMFRAWGQELPKAWRVLEEGRALDSSPGSREGFADPPRMQRKGSWLSSKSTAGEGPERTEVDAEEETKGMGDVLRGCRRVVVIGIHGWFPGMC